ncbi:MAG: hypothetical protein AB7W59_00150 [Acidimicrobiia bacterium]
MAIRRFGPTRGAGVVIQEQAGDPTIEPGALGWAGYAGLFEKGPVGELVLCSKGAQFSKKMGGVIEDGQAPDAALDYYRVAAGAGGLALVRVTDGNELAAELTLYQRKVGAAPAVLGTIKAKNGGRWGGKQRRYTAEVAALADIEETQLTTGVATFTTDQWKGGYIELQGVPNARYPIVGNTAAGVVTVEADATMDTDLGVGTDKRYYLVLDHDADKAVTILIGDGEDNPDTEFSVSVYVDGLFVKKYPNLNTDPNSARYWVNLINNDDGNDEIEAVGLWTGSHTAATRPANVYGTIATVTELTLTADIHLFAITSPVAGGNPTFALGTTTDAHLPQKITITMTDPTTGTAVSDKYGALGTVTLGTLFDPGAAAGGANANKWVPPFTVTAGATPLVAADTLEIWYFPLTPGQLVGGFVYPDKVNAKREKYRITANTHKVITVAAGSDLTASGAAMDQFLVEAPQWLQLGRDGNADVVDADYENQAWDVNNSPFNRVVDKNLGLIKFATPGVTATAVQKAGKSYAEAKNHQYRYECPDNIVTENGAIALVNETLGRSDYAVMTFPSYGYSTDPNPDAAREGKLKLVTLTGQIHGREAATARDFQGYHKAAAGIDQVLPRTLKLPTGDAVLDEELLNPAGIAVIKRKRGNFVIWGDRTLHLDPTWKFKHQRELMSYYEQVLMENFDFIVFAINDPATEKDALTALKLFFQPELVKRAIREEAQIKIDAENNTDATRATGDMFADIALRLADVVERFTIRIGKQGIFESVS